jgi:hypothetical protein
MKVFLGGTTNGSKWRNEVKEHLIIDFFNPVVYEQDKAAYERELYEKRYCNYILYVLTPKMTNQDVLKEITVDSYKRPDKIIYCYLNKDDESILTPKLEEDLFKLGQSVAKNGGLWLKTLDEVVSFLNSSSTEINTEDFEFYDAFVSYGRRESKDLVLNIANQLDNLELKVFADLGEIPLFIENEDYIYSKILHADNFIYVISPNAVRSEYCRKQLEFAIKFNKRIIPIVHRRLGQDIQHLDDTISKKNILELERKKPEEHLPELIELIVEVINMDKEYVRSNSEYMFKARNWDFGGRKQSDLLYGDERKKAISWLNTKSQSIVPLQILINYIEASKKISIFIIPLLWLNQRMKWISTLRGFDQLAMILSLLGPIAMMDQIRKLAFSDNPSRYAEIPLFMWMQFLLINLVLVLVGIKTKDLRVFLSKSIAFMVSAIVVAMVLLNLYL